MSSGRMQSQDWALSPISKCQQAPTWPGQFQVSVRLREALRWLLRAENTFPWNNGDIRKRISRPPVESRAREEREEVGVGGAGPGKLGGRWGPSWSDHAATSGRPVSAACL